MKRNLIFLLLMGLFLGFAVGGWSQAAPGGGGPGVTIPYVDLNVRSARGQDEVATSLQVLLLLTVLSLAPAIMMMTTSFVRVAIVLSFVRQALATQQLPPTQVLMGLSLFLTFFIMRPTFNQVYEKAYVPLTQNKINLETAVKEAAQPMRTFMFRQARSKDIGLFIELSGSEVPDTPEDVPTLVLIPAFMISELQTAFQIGILIFIPFIVIDMVVSSTLMSMGMIMLPPVMVSMPFKLILFVLVGGWNLTIEQLVKSFGQF